MYDVEAVHVLDGADELGEHEPRLVFAEGASQSHVLQQVSVTGHLHHHHDLHSLSSRVDMRTHTAAAQ